MTPSEKTIVRALIAVAWADGTVDKPESGLIDGLLWAFGASDEEDAELRKAAESKTSLDDVDLSPLEESDQEQLLAHAALLTHADGEQTDEEKALLAKVVAKLGIDDAKAQSVIADADKRAGKLAEGIKQKKK